MEEKEKGEEEGKRNKCGKGGKKRRIKERNGDEEKRR